MSLPQRFARLVAVAALTAASATSAAAQTDTVRAGGPGYRTFELAVGVDSTNVFMLRDTTRMKLMTYIETVSEIPDGYLIVGENIRPDGVRATLDSVAVSRGTLAPRWHSDVTPAGSMRVAYAGERITGMSVDTIGRESPVDATVAPGAFDYSMARLVVNRLPLAPGYQSVLLTHDVKRGSVPVGVRVVGLETITVAGRRAEAWKVEMNYGTFTAERWIDRTTLLDLRTRVEAGGRTMIVEPAG